MVVKVVSGAGVLVRERVASEQCQGAADVRDEELKNGVEVQKGPTISNEFRGRRRTRACSRRPASDMRRSFEYWRVAGRG